MQFGLFVHVFEGVLVLRVVCLPSSLHAASPVDEQGISNQKPTDTCALFSPQLVRREAGKWTTRPLRIPIPRCLADGTRRVACVRLWGVLGIQAFVGAVRPREGPCPPSFSQEYLGGGLHLDY